MIQRYYDMDFLENGTRVAIREVPGLKLGKSTYGETKMNTIYLNLLVKLQDLTNREEGQDLVEYALVVALIALGATAAMTKLGTGISTAFTNISTTLATALG